MNRLKVGVGVAVIKNNKVLLGKRIGSHGEGTWAFPGGHLELGESIEDCAKREVLEETGITITNLKRLSFTNDIFGTEKHYVTLYIAADYENGEVKIREPEKCQQWDWFDWDKLPQPRFLGLQHLLEQDIKYLLNR